MFGLTTTVELTWGFKPSSPQHRRSNEEGLSKRVSKNLLTKTTTTVCKQTGKVIKKTTVVWPIKLLLSVLDLLAGPFGNMPGKNINFHILWKVGCAIILVSFWIFVLIHSEAAELFRQVGLSAKYAFGLTAIIQALVPGAMCLAGIMMVVGGMRLQQGKSFMAKYGKELEPLPAFESGIVFRIGDIKMSLRDMHTGVGAFGGIGTGKTVSFMVPMLRQFFRQLRDPDDNSEYAKCGALILDEKGDFIDSTITEMLLAGRSLQDLVLIDPDLDLYRYNPLDPDQTADENAAKLAKVQKILGTTSGSDNAYWDQTSQATIKYFLQLLEVYKPKHKIGLDDIARFMRDDDLATVLCDTVEKTLERKKANNEISEEDYGAYTDAISATRNAWIRLNPNTKSTLKTTITNMLGPIAQNPRLQKVFCRDTNFSFKDLPNKGKIVLFRGSGIDKATARLICVCLKIDFQTWQKRRNGSAAERFGLNTKRTVLFMCDEYQEFVTCGGEGDETFYGVSRSTRTAPIVATQSYNSLETAIKNKEQTKTLRQNIATWVFFRSTDEDTCKLGEFLAGKSKKEDYSTSQDTTGILETASNLTGSSGSHGRSINVSKKWEENFRADDFSRLITMTMEKSKTGPWYSEAIVYHYHDIDEEAESRCYKTRLPHLYYPDDLRKKATNNVKHLDWILIDRNWQRKVTQRAQVMIQRAKEACEEEIKQEQLRASIEQEIQQKKEEANESPEMKAQRERIERLLQAKKETLDQDKESLKKGYMEGGINNSEGIFTKEEAENRIRELHEQLDATEEEEDREKIRIQISEHIKKLSEIVIKQGFKEHEGTKMVLRSNGIPGRDDDYYDEDAGDATTESDEEEYWEEEDDDFEVSEEEAELAELWGMKLTPSQEISSTNIPYSVLDESVYDGRDLITSESRRAILSSTAGDFPEGESQTITVTQESEVFEEEPQTPIEADETISTEQSDEKDTKIAATGDSSDDDDTLAEFGGNS